MSNASRDAVKEIFNLITIPRYFHPIRRSDGTGEGFRPNEIGAYHKVWRAGSLEIRQLDGIWNYYRITWGKRLVVDTSDDLYWRYHKGTEEDLLALHEALKKWFAVHPQTTENPESSPRLFKKLPHRDSSGESGKE